MPPVFSVLSASASVNTRIIATEYQHQRAGDTATVVIQKHSDLILTAPSISPINPTVSVLSRFLTTFLQTCELEQRMCCTMSSDTVWTLSQIPRVRLISCLVWRRKSCFLISSFLCSTATTAASWWTMRITPSRTWSVFSTRSSPSQLRNSPMTSQYLWTSLARWILDSD